MFHQDLALEIQTRREAQVFVRRTSKAINASMTASPVRVDAGVEADVRTVVAGDDRTGDVTQVDRLRAGLLVRLSGLRLDLYPAETILGIACRLATDDTSPIPFLFLHRLFLTDPRPPHYTLMVGLEYVTESKSIKDQASPASTGRPPPRPAPSQTRRTASASLLSVSVPSSKPPGNPSPTFRSTTRTLLPRP